MFEGYNYIPGTFIPVNNYPPQDITPPVVKPLEIYNINDEFIGYGWNCGDSIVLEFTTTGRAIYDEEGTYEDAETYLAGKKLQLIIFDFRYNPVYNITTDAAVVTKFYIDETTSKNIVKGPYTFRLILIDEENSLKFTLMPQGSEDKCNLYIN